MFFSAGITSHLIPRRQYTCDGDVQQMHAGASQEPDLHLFVTSPFLGAAPAHVTLRGIEEQWR